MDLDPSRLRRGEWVAGAGAIALLASIYVLAIIATMFLIPELKGKALE